MNTKQGIMLLALLLWGMGSSPLFGQRFKGKLGGKGEEKESKMYECGYVYSPSLKDKLNPMRALQKAVGSGVTNSGQADLGKISISVFYQAHLHPQEIMRYPTATPGWATCGDAVYLGMTNHSGMGLSDTDGTVSMDGQTLPPAGMGTYFHGFPEEERSDKQVRITSSEGDEIQLSVAPAAPLEILSIDGKSKGEAIVIDGSKDLVIELADGDSDPNSRLHVSLVSKVVGTPVLYDIWVTTPQNRIVVPKEAFVNYEGSPAPFDKTNTLIVNRVVEKIHDGTQAGAIRTLSAYMDWAPVTMEGDIAKGSIITAGFDSTKNTQIAIDLENKGKYELSISKGNPYNSPPIKRIKKIAVASFVVRGNLEGKETSTQGDWTVITTKWFPELKKESWQGLSEQMYLKFEGALEAQLGAEIMPLAEVISADAYAYTKTITDDVTQNYVEVGAGGTKRMLTSSFSDIFEDLSITFPADFVSERLIQELGVDAVVAITVDLNFNFTSEGLDPRVQAVFFAPNISHKTAAQYARVGAKTTALSLEESKKYRGGTSEVLYQMIQWDTFIEEFQQGMEKLKQQEAQHPVYEKLGASIPESN